MSNVPSFYLGSVVKVRVTLTSSTASTVGVDPGGLTFYVKEPDGTTHSYVYSGTSTSVLKVTTGTYDGYFPTVQEGLHYAGWLGTGSNAGADEVAFFVNKRRYD